MRFGLIDTRSTTYLKEKLLRWEVLVKPLGLPPGAEVFPDELESLHWVALEKTEVIGCIVFHQETADRGRICHLAVAQEYRGPGIYRRMVGALENELKKRGVKEVCLEAKGDVVSFYRRLGFRPRKIFEDRTPVLQTMVKRLSV